MDDEELLSRLRERYSGNNTKNYNVLDFIGGFGSPFEALIYSRLFWPEFIEIDGMVFLKETIESPDDRERLSAAFEKCDRNPRATEKSFNLVEVPSTLFGPRVGETTEREDRLLAERLVEMWRARLETVFPGRPFIVRLVEPEESGGDVGVIFHQTDIY